MSDIKPMHLGRVPPLLASESVDPSISSEDYDWDGGGYAGEASVNDQWKQPCRVATTAPITISTALNNGDTLDGVTLATGDRVLVKDQSTGSQNGIYIVGTTPERAADMDDDDEVVGALVYVIAGTTNGGTIWRNTNTSTPTIDTTSLTFSAFSASVSFGTPANTYGTPAAGAASTAVRTDAVLPGPPIVILTLTNKSGGSVAAGDVVIIDTANDTAFTTTTTGRAEVSVGIAQATIASNASGAVLVSGYAGLVNVPASVTRGHYVETHTVVKQATGSSSRRSGSFGQFLTGGTTPTAWLWGQTDQTASGGGSLTVEEVDGSPTDSAVTKIVFPNGTLGIVSHVATYTPSGGSGNVTAPNATSVDQGAVNLLVRQAASNTEDDLFDASSLDAKWLTFTGYNASTSLTAKTGWCKITSAGAKLQAVPAGDWTIEAEVLAAPTTAAAYTTGGLILTNGTTQSSANEARCSIGLNNSADQTRVFFERFINGAFNSAYRQDNPSIGGLLPMFMRIIKSSTTYTVQFGIARESVQFFTSTSSLGFTPTHFGFHGDTGVYINGFYRL